MTLPVYIGARRFKTVQHGPGALRWWQWRLSYLRLPRWRNYDDRYQGVHLWIYTAFGAFLFCAYRRTRVK